jgi:hypothetical protein
VGFVVFGIWFLVFSFWLLIFDFWFLVLGFRVYLEQSSVGCERFEDDGECSR